MRRKMWAEIQKTMTKMATITTMKTMKTTKKPAWMFWRVHVHVSLLSPEAKP